jgi:hypothetical protein
VRSGEIVEALPLEELVVEELGVVDDLAGQHPIELFVIDSMRALDLAVEPRRRGPDVDVLDAFVQEVPMEAGLELGAVVGLDLHDFERQLLEDVVDEPDCGRLVQALVDPEDPQASAVVDGGVLVVLLADAFDGLDELDVNLNRVARLLLLVALPAFGVALVPLRRRQPVEVSSLQDPPDAGRAHRDVVIALEVHGDLGWAKVVVLPKVEDLADHVGLGRVRANQRPMGPLAKALRPELLVAAEPEVELLSRDSEIPTRHGDAASNLLDVLDDGESPSCSPG